MQRHTQENILIAGFGKTGQSVADYLSSRFIGYAVCDDGEGYESCQGVQVRNAEYIFKSPGLSQDGFVDISQAHRLLNDVEYFLRINRRPVICVTGTNGKSTVVALLEHALNQCGVRSVACGNNGVPVLRALEGKYDIYILELSSYQLENIASLCSLSSVVLNVGIDHVDRYKSMQAYSDVKQRIYSGSENQIVPVNELGDVEYGNEITGYLNKHSGNTFRFQGDDIYRNEVTVLTAADIRIYGPHNYLNICAALALAEPLGIDWQRFVNALKSFPGLAHRMEVVHSSKEHGIWINDSKATNVHATHAALSSIDQSCCLIMGGKGKGECYRDLFSQYHRTISRLLVFGESAQVIAEDAKYAGVVEVSVVETIRDAVELAVAGTERLFLFSPACASFDQYSNYEERGSAYRDCVNERLSC